MDKNFDCFDYELLCCRKGMSVLDDGSGEYIALLAVSDPETGEKGHMLFEYGWEEQDVAHEIVLTDNPAFVVDPDALMPSAHGAFAVAEDRGSPPREHPAEKECTITAWEGYTY